MTSYFRLFASESEADEHMRWLNRRARTLFVLIDGPEDNYAVVDLNTAIETDCPYRWAVAK